MSRSVRLFAIALLASVAFSLAACSDVTGPKAGNCDEISGLDTCLQAGISGSGT